MLFPDHMKSSSLTERVKKKSDNHLPWFKKDAEHTEFQFVLSYFMYLLSKLVIAHAEYLVKKTIC